MRRQILLAMARGWWTFVLRGVLAILFGIAAVAWPALTLWVLVMLFGGYLIVDGLFALVAAFRDGVHWSLLAWGLLNVLAGAAAIAWPGITALILVFLIAAWAVVTGGVEIAAAFALRKEIQGEWLLALAGLLSIVVGILLAVRPGTGALSLAWLIGGYAIAFGALLIMVGIRLRRWCGEAMPPGAIS